MTHDSVLHLKFPIGKFNPPKEITPQHVEEWITSIETFPERFTAVAKMLSDKQLDTPYREGGWTARQVIHHVPDSHVNSYIRFKWALTEDSPTIKAYNEAAWAELADTKNQPIELSLDFLKVVHAKLTILLRSISPEQLKSTFTHPESGNKITLDSNIGGYAWHGDHHLGHLKLVSKS